MIPLDASGYSGMISIPLTEERGLNRLYYTPREVAHALAISDDAVLDLIKRGDMPALRVSPRIIRIPIAAFDLWRSGFLPARRRVTIRPTARELAIGAGEHTERSELVRG